MARRLAFWQRHVPSDLGHERKRDHTTLNIQIGESRFWTKFVRDPKDGYSGFQIHRESFGRTVHVGNVLYWDACGRFVFGTRDGEDIPVEIVQAAIAEAREKIKLR